MMEANINVSVYCTLRCSAQVSRCHIPGSLHEDLINAVEEVVRSCLEDLDGEEGQENVEDFMMDRLGHWPGCMKWQME